jgi:hypothetical protein
MRFDDGLLLEEQADSGLLGDQERPLDRVG